MQKKRDSTEAWVKRWQSAAVQLEKIRHTEIRRADTRLAIERLDDAFRSALLHSSPKTTSGLVEQQKWFRRLEVSKR